MFQSVILVLKQNLIIKTINVLKKFFQQYQYIIFKNCQTCKFITLHPHIYFFIKKFPYLLPLVAPSPLDFSHPLGLCRFREALCNRQSLQYKYIRQWQIAEGGENIWWRNTRCRCQTIAPTPATLVTCRGSFHCCGVLLTDLLLCL